MSIIIRLQNLAWAATAADIRNLFSGLVIPEGGVHIVGGVEADAFIAFATDEDARQAMRNDQCKIKGEKIKLLLSSRVEMQQVIEKARGEISSSHSIETPIHSPNQKIPSRNSHSPTQISPVGRPKFGSHYGGGLDTGGPGAVSGFSSFPQPGINHNQRPQNDDSLPDGYNTRRPYEVPQRMDNVHVPPPRVDNMSYEKRSYGRQNEPREDSWNERQPEPRQNSYASRPPNPRETNLPGRQFEQREAVPFSRHQDSYLGKLSDRQTEPRQNQYASRSLDPRVNHWDNPPQQMQPTPFEMHRNSRSDSMDFNSNGSQLRFQNERGINHPESLQSYNSGPPSLMANDIVQSGGRDPIPWARNDRPGSGSSPNFDRAGPAPNFDRPGPGSNFDRPGPVPSFDRPAPGPAPNFDRPGPESNFDRPAPGSVPNFDRPAPGPVPNFDRPGPVPNFDPRFSGGVTEGERIRPEPQRLMSLITTQPKPQQNYQPNFPPQIQNEQINGGNTFGRPEDTNWRDSRRAARPTLLPCPTQNPINLSNPSNDVNVDFDSRASFNDGGPKMRVDLPPPSSQIMPQDPMHRPPIQNRNHNNVVAEAEFYICMDRLIPEMRQYKVLKEFLRSGGVEMDKEEPVRICRENKAGQQILTAYVRLPNRRNYEIALGLNGHNGIRIVHCSLEDFDWASQPKKLPIPANIISQGATPNPWLAGVPPGRNGVQDDPNSRVPFANNNNNILPINNHTNNSRIPTDPPHIFASPPRQQNQEFVVEMNNLPYRARENDVMSILEQTPPSKLVKAGKDGLDCDIWFAVFNSQMAYDRVLRSSGVAQVRGRNIYMKVCEPSNLTRRIDEIQRRLEDRKRRASPPRDRERGREYRNRDSRRRSRSRSRDIESLRSRDIESLRSRDIESSRSMERERSKRSESSSSSIHKEKITENKSVEEKIQIAEHKTVAISGLPTNTTENDVKQLILGMNVTPSEIHMVTNVPGSAFVQFDKICDCSKVASIKQQHIGIAKVTFRSCDKSEVADNFRKQQLRSENANGINSIKPAEEVIDVEDPMPSKPCDPTEGPPIDAEIIASIGAPGFVLVMHGLPPTVSLDELALFFHGFDLLEDSVRMHFNDKGQATGDALLAVASAQKAKAAVTKLNGKTLLGYTVKMYTAHS